jgi:hypothetical protein
MDALAVKGIKLLCDECFKRRFTKKEMGCILMLLEYLYDKMRDDHEGRKK